MALDQTPGVIATPTRDEVRDRFTQSYALRVPAAEVGPGTQPYVDGSVAADTTAPIYADAVTIGRGTNLSTSAGPWLATIAKDEGIAPRPAVGAAGFVTVSAAAGGTTIQEGAVLLSKIGNKRFQVTNTALYLDGQPCPIQGIDTGPETNLPAGAVLEFQAPPPGCNPIARVRAQSDGSGLTGGRPADDDATLRILISDKRANPPASGNDAEYQQAIRETPAISIQQVFTYPAIRGPGTIAYVFTLNPSRPGGSRAPNAAQIAATYAQIVGQMPADDSIFACDLREVGLRVCLQITWAPGAASWVDATPWPAYLTNDPVIVAGAPAPSLTSFRLTTGTSTSAPQVGQTIGFWDPATGTFKRIRIGAVSVVVAGKTWDITPNRDNNASDPSYIPSAGQPASPWSESLNLVAPAVIAYFDGLGPGEQVASLPDPGMRQRRQPQSPGKYPSVVNNKLLVGLLNGSVPAVTNAVPLEPSGPYATPVGTPAVLSNLLVLGNLALFP